MSKQRQKAREGMTPTDDDMALYTAARAFLFGEWVGAVAMVLSFTQLFIFGLQSDTAATISLIVGLALLTLGAAIFWSSRTYFLRLDILWRRKWELAATIVAGSGVVFWLLFGLLSVLVWGGIPIQK